MILQELSAYYDRLLQDPEKEVPAQYWSTEKAAWEFEIDEHGALVGATPLFTGEGKDAHPAITMQVPEHETRTSGKKPFFLCDNAAYLLGLDKKDGAAKLTLSTELHQAVLADVDDPAAKAILMFFQKTEEALEWLGDSRREKLEEGRFIVFRLTGDSARTHERPAIRQAWESFCLQEASKDTEEGQCAVTGERSPIATAFPQVTGIPGAQSAGASLVSFNKDSFESYGKKRTGNAAISKDVAFKAGSALRYLFNDPGHRARFGDTTILFWTDRPAEMEKELVSLTFGLGQNLSADSKEDTERIANILGNIKKGRTLEGCDPEVRFFILGISPNAARLAVRFFEVSTFGSLMKHYGEYLNDIDMVGVKPVSLFALLRQTAPLGRAEAIPSTLIHASVHAMLTGNRFPRSLYLTLLSRMRADHASNNAWDMGQRAALMRACLVRDQRFRLKDHNITSQITNQTERRIPVALDKTNKNEAYCLGRLFAVLEHAQAKALGELNATIKDRYFSAASTTPNRVFPVLLRKSTAHFSKLEKEKPGLCRVLENETDDIFKVGDFGTDFPKALGVNEQGPFYIGYHEERADLRAWKKEDVTVEEDAEE